MGLAATRTAGSPGNALASQSLASLGTKTFTLDLSAVAWGDLLTQVVAGGAVAATAGVTIACYRQVGTGPTAETVASVSGTVPVTTASATTDRAIRLDQGIWQIILTNTDATNAVTVSGTLDTFN